MNPEQFERRKRLTSKLKRPLYYESHHQSQSNEKSVVQFDYEKAVSNYLGTQSTFKYSLMLVHMHVGAGGRYIRAPLGPRERANVSSTRIPPRRNDTN